MPAYKVVDLVEDEETKAEEAAKENYREYPIKGNKIIMTREDPYGFIYLSYAKGNLPESLKGAYTSFLDAKKAIEGFINAKGRALES